jgi:hypothetical protein
LEVADFGGPVRISVIAFVFDIQSTQHFEGGRQRNVD